MITYKLNENGMYAQKIVDSIETGEWANTETNQTYLAWVAEGNLPYPSDYVEPSQASVTQLPSENE